MEVPISVEQFGGGDVGKLRYRFIHGGTAIECKQPDQRRERIWMLDDFVFTPEGRPLDLEVSFWWDGSERAVAYHWPQESDFQTANTTVTYR